MDKKEFVYVKISEHAYLRAKERLGWRADVLDKMAIKAISSGIHYRDAKGTLKRYLNKLYLERRGSNNTRIYGQVLFLFNGLTLITVYQIPNSLKKHVKINLMSKNDDFMD